MTGCVQARKYPLPYFKIQQSINKLYHFPKRHLFSVICIENAMLFLSPRIGMEGAEKGITYCNAQTLHLKSFLKSAQKSHALFSQ